jgi:succinyl-CoA synthetase alpha subunit
VSAVVRGAVHRQSYRDSVELMGMAATLESLPGVRRAGIVMGTEANLAVLAGAGLGGAVTDGAGPNDLIVAVIADDEATAEAAITRAAELLTAEARSDAGGDRPAERPQTIGEALGVQPDANLAVISTPGAYAAAEALKALKRGLSVFLFSDNVSLADEIDLKREAARRDLLVMGPDCGTAIVGGVPLGFANAVRRGTIGIVAASGTGLQQVSCLIDRLGGGVSHALGTGGRDLDERVGGLSMLAGIDALLGDPLTRVLVLISKPPSASVADAVLARATAGRMPVIVNFLGGDPDAALRAGASPASTFDEAARLAVAAAGLPLHDAPAEDPALSAHVRAIGNRLVPDAAILGLYSGGSLASEAKLILHAELGAGRRDRGLDLGDDEYTVGRPHPMIDPRLRSEEIVAAASDASVGVILLDIVLGHGSHPDPAGALVPAIERAQVVARDDGRAIAIVGTVVGTERDPQGLAAQERTLERAGVSLAASNAAAARLAAAIVLEASGAGRSAATAAEARS